MVKRIIIFTVFVFALMNAHAQQRQLFNNGWEFVKDIDSVFSDKLLKKKAAVKWDKVSLPHTASIEPIEKKAQHWQGIAFYRKFFTVPASGKGKHVAIQFDAAMQEADVYLNGEHIFNHQGGYLPFYIDVSNKIKFGQENSLVVRLDNRDNPQIPPGKSLKTLDFNYYSGIYRNAWMIVKDRLYISDAVASNLAAGGGVLIRYENVNDRSATMVVQTDIRNDFEEAKNAQVRITIKDKSGKVVAQSTSKSQVASAKSFQRFTYNLSIANPKLWSPENPYLYVASIELLQNGKAVDKEIVKTGIRDVRLQDNTLYLNGKKTKIRGTNRHQEYPYVGNAASDNAQYRDAWKIKEAGFNFVRSSHYPQSPAFLDACDELGILVMDAI
ncbi:MAG TPA: glycoside hydrolase family 2 TIM barrel-domain containing protein, partial [Flavisolibacter sp.]|nr:glycoside hydrolase family 2 TIM barrel-domain containing protein [Flavisolibacter sp.]